MPAAGDDPNALADDVKRETIAVPFHLEGPIVTNWRLALELRETRLDPIGHWVDEEVALRPLAPRRSLYDIDAQPGSENPTRTHLTQLHNATSRERAGD